MTQPVSITIFGGGGFVGRYLVRALVKTVSSPGGAAADGWHRIRIVARDAERVRREWNASRDAVIARVSLSGSVSFVSADVANEEAVRRALDPMPQSVVNLAGILYETPPWQTFERVHVQGAENIAQAVSGQRDTIVTQVSAIGADFTAADSQYARSKGLAEEALHSHLGGRVVLLRPSVIFGEEDQLFRRFRDMARLSPFLPLVGGGWTRFQPVHVEDVAQALLRCVLPERRAQRVQRSVGDGESLDEPRHLYELGGRDVVTFREMMEKLLQVTGMRRLLLPIPFTVAEWQASAFEAVHRLVPGIPPLLTHDQVAMLRRDNVVSPGACGLTELGVEAPRGLDAVSLAYLAR
ncbi:hypothetical protein CDCA_CDCA20G4792 [Cyanidium caldarium]|uniref:NAD-dependent epimerase/dehydratase domain-containing protein n=1 Tax=Cyanidium caldarium TaxID=2771 RepID=A0AAV9J2G2_CYACA|nr:hypothetical protein CDCA_CDCA20G4792 [Cyanidium caldarium]